MTQHLINGQVINERTTMSPNNGIAQNSVSLTTDYTEVVGINLLRTYAAFINDSGAEIYLRFGNTEHAPGIPLTTIGSSYEMTMGANNIFMGAVYARAATTPATLSVTEEWYAN